MLGAPARRSYAALALVLAGALLGGCYRSHTRPAPAPSDAGGGRDAGGPDAGEAPDAEPRPCRWEVTEQRSITEPPDDEALTDVRWTGRAYLIGSYGAVPPTAPVVRAFRWGEAPSAPQRLFGPPPGAGWFMPMAIRTSGEAVGALRATSLGCDFRPLAADGTPLGPVRDLGISGGCRSLHATAGGFSLLGGISGPDGVSLHRITPAGDPVGEPSLLEVFAPYYNLHAQLTFEDGSQLFVVARDEGGGILGRAQRLTAEGLPVAPVEELPAVAEFTWLRLVETGEGALLAWLGSDPGGPDPEARGLRTLRLSRDGRALEAPAPIPGHRVRAGSDWSMLRVRDSIFVVFVEPAADDPTGEVGLVQALRIDEAGAPIEPPLLVDTAVGARQVLGRTDGAELLVACTAITEAGSREILAHRIECVPER